MAAPVVTVPAILPLVWGTTLGVSAAMVYAAPTTGSPLMVYITGIRLANYGSLVTTVRGYHLPKGQAVADRYMFYPDVTINGKTTYAEGFRPQEFSLGAGDQLWFLAGVATSVNLFIYGAVQQ